MDFLGKQINKIQKESGELKRQVKEKVVTAIIAALGLVTGLAWNDAIKALIESLFPLGRNTLLAKFVYALIITAVVIILSVYLVRIFKKKEE